MSLTEQEEAAACAVCLGLHDARGDYGDCDSATVARLDSARTLRVVAMVSVARLARCAVSGSARTMHAPRACSWRLATIFMLAPHPQ